MSVNFEENWESHWKEILQKPDGSINIEQLKLELADFTDLIHRMIELTSEITGNRMSYATYPVKTILQVMEEDQEQKREYQKADDLEDGVCSLCESELPSNFQVEDIIIKPFNKGNTFWMQRESGEGLEIGVYDLYRLLDRYFDENM